MAPGTTIVVKIKLSWENYKEIIPTIILFLKGTFLPINFLLPFNIAIWGAYAYVFSISATG